MNGLAVCSALPRGMLSGRILRRSSIGQGHSNRWRHCHEEAGDELSIAGESFESRLFVGTGKFSSGEALRGTVDSSGSEMVTVAMKRANPKERMTRYSAIWIPKK